MSAALSRMGWVLKDIIGKGLLRARHLTLSGPFPCWCGLCLRLLGPAELTTLCQGSGDVPISLETPFLTLGYTGLMTLPTLAAPSYISLGCPVLFAQAPVDKKGGRG